MNLVRSTVPPYPYAHPAILPSAVREDANVITREQALAYHSEGRPGKLKISPTKPTATQRDLSLAYSPGVAEPCREIARDPDEVFQAMYLPGGPRNQLRWEDPKLTELFEQQTRESDPARRRRLIAEAETRIRQGETGWMTLFWAADFANMVSQRVTNFHTPQTLHTVNTHEHLWLDAK